MKKLILICSAILVGLTSFAQKEQLHSARIIGSYMIGELEITTIYDLTSECERKSSPHGTGLFIANEIVELRFDESSDMAEVIKEGLTEQVYAELECNSTARAGDGPGEVSISCAGTCDCSLQGVLSGEESYVACSCDECTMELVFTSAGLHGNDTTEYKLNDQTTMEVPFLEEYLDFAQTDFVLQEIIIYRDVDSEAVLYTYTDTGGEERTVMFARVGGKTYRISCEGDCGCREVYSFETNSASCSCDDCVMTVEEVSNQ